jgi:hypothetical protein
MDTRPRWSDATRRADFISFPLSRCIRIMIHPLSKPTVDRIVPAKSREESAAPEIILAAARQFKVLQSRAAPAQLALPLGGVVLSPCAVRGTTPGKSFRTA